MTPEELKEIEQLSESEFRKRLFGEIKELSAKVDPMYEMFTSVSGFNKISVWILKLLAGIGAALVGLYAIIELFKKLGR